MATLSQPAKPKQPKSKIKTRQTIETEIQPKIKTGKPCHELGTALSLEGKRIGTFQRNNQFIGIFCFLLTE